MGGSMSPNPVDAIPVEHAVDSDNGKLFYETLSNDESIERVAVMERKLGDFRRVMKRYVKQVDAVKGKLLWNELVEGEVDLELAEAHFDRDLPYACHA